MKNREIRMKDFEKIEKKIEIICENERIPKEKYFVLPGEDIAEKIVNAEKELQVTFPKSYKKFLLKMGSGGICGYDFLGIECNKDDVKMFTVVYMTNKYREKGLDKNLIVIEDDGEYVTCLDTRKMEICNDNGDECPIVTWSIYDKDNIVFKNQNFYCYIDEILDEYIEENM